MTTLNDANQSDVSTADQTEQTTDVSIALFEEVRAREYHPKTSPPCDAHASSVRAVVTPRCVRVPQVSSDPGKFAGDDVITEQTAQTFSAVLGTTETMSDTTVDAITEALQEARDLSAQSLGGRSLGAISRGPISLGQISGASPAGARGALGGRHLGRHRRREHRMRVVTHRRHPRRRSRRCAGTAVAARRRGRRAEPPAWRRLLAATARAAVAAAVASVAAG